MGSVEDKPVRLTARPSEDKEYRDCDAWRQAKCQKENLQSFERLEIPHYGDDIENHPAVHNSKSAKCERRLHFDLEGDRCLHWNPLPERSAWITSSAYSFNLEHGIWMQLHKIRHVAQPFR